MNRVLFNLTLANKPVWRIIYNADNNWVSQLGYNPTGSRGSSRKGTPHFDTALALAEASQLEGEAPLTLKSRQSTCYQEETPCQWQIAPVDLSSARQICSLPPRKICNTTKPYTQAATPSCQRWHKSNQQSLFLSRHWTPGLQMCHCRQPTTYSPMMTHIWQYINEMSNTHSNPAVTKLQTICNNSFNTFHNN